MPLKSAPRLAGATRVAWLIVAFVLATGVIGGLHRARANKPDWDDLQFETRYVWEHRHTAPGTAMFGYLPTTTYLLWPFTTWLPRPFGSVAFVTLNLLALLASIWIVHRWWRPAGSADLPPPYSAPAGRPISLVWPVLLACANFQHALQSNQLTAWTLLLCVAGLTLVGRQRQFLGGLVIGLAALVKVMPGLLVVYLLLRGRWRALLGVAVAAVVFDALPSVAFFGWRGTIDEHLAWRRRAAWHSNRHLIEQPLLRVHRHGTNASLSAVLTRWLRALPDAHEQVILYGDPPPDVVARRRAELAPGEVLTLDPMPPRDAPWTEKRVDISWVPRFHVADQPASVVWWLWATPLALGFAALAWFTFRAGRAQGADWPALSALWLLAMFWPAPMTRHYYLAWAFPVLVVVCDMLRYRWNRTPRWTAGTVLATSALAAWLVGVAALGSKVLRWYGLHLAVLALLTAATAWAWQYSRHLRSGNASREVSAPPRHGID